MNIVPALQEYYPRLAKLFMSSDPWKRLGTTYEELFSILTDSACTVIVALEGNEIAGCVVFELNGSLRGYIKLMAVEESFRGQNIGRRMMQRAEEEIFRLRRNVFLCVSGFNTGAQKFYEALGYTVIGELQDYLVPGENEILMRKTRGPLYGSFTPAKRQTKESVLPAKE